MNLQCEFEAAVLESVQLGRWPHSVDGELRRHVADCNDCGAVVELASMLLDDRRELEPAAVLPSSEGVWMRMQIEMRREATANAARTVTTVQRAAWLVIAGAAIGMTALTSLGAWIMKGVQGLDVPSLSLEIPTLSMATPSVALLMLLAATALLFTPVVLYAALSKD
jgi:hypothetical protein